MRGGGGLASQRVLLAASYHRHEVGVIDFADCAEPDGVWAAAGLAPRFWRDHASITAETIAAAVKGAIFGRTGIALYSVSVEISHAYSTDQGGMISPWMSQRSSQVWFSFQRNTCPLI